MQLVLLILATAAVQCTLGAKVIGGEDAAPGEFPYMVSLRRSGSHDCGGSIISDSVILTAGHCVNGKSPSSITIVSGTTTLDSGGNSHTVSEVIIHADFNKTGHLNDDIAILKLSKPITLSSLEKPIALPSQGESPDANCIASGWGFTKYPSLSLPNNLQKVKLQLVENDKCKSQHTIANTMVYPTHVCAGTVSGEGVCHADSGGPLVSGGKQIGIVSTGIPCAIGFPDIFTRVASYADWIAEKSA